MKKLMILAALIPGHIFANPLPINFFESPEHLIIGDAVKLKFNDNDPGQANAKLHLANGLVLSYGEILTFGDYYEVPKQPISQALTSAEQTRRFLTGFESFAVNPAVVKEATQIVALIHQEEKTVQDAIDRGDDPEKVYANIGEDINRQLNCITGGGCSSAWWLDEGRFLTLAKTDYDHFGDQALLSYHIGHMAAMQQAVKAGQTHDAAGLEIAYAMNAFACHFLSDRFAAGHIRTPRVALATTVTPQVVGSLLSSYMHNEENSAGLHVHNANNDHWVLYGDRTYLNPSSRATQQIMHTALQISADQIYSAYQSGSLSNDDAVFAYVPYPDENENQANIDISPLFYWDDSAKTIFRRNDVDNLFDHQWTSNWWGFTTLTELAKERGIPPVYKNALTP